MLEEMGLKKAAVLKDADVVVFNTCHIREKAAEKVFSDLGRAYLVKLERAAEGRDTISELPAVWFRRKTKRY